MQGSVIGMMATEETIREQQDRDAATPVEARAVPPASSLEGLVLIGVNHDTAPIDVRERLAIPSARLAEATRRLAQQPGVREALIVSTCNRVELLLTRDGHAQAPQPTASDTLDSFFHEFFSVQLATLKPHLYERHEQEAIRHLFRVASSLDSMVVGDAQILGQVKHAWTVAREVGAIRGSDASAASGNHEASILDPLLQRAFFVAKRVRTETQVGSSNVSIASVAADLARKIFGSLSGKTILIVGAGKMSELAARHLIQQGANTLLVSNRTEARAQKIAESLRTASITTGILPFDELHAQSHRADIVITSTGAAALGGEPVFTPAQARALLQRRRNRPVFFIDIAVPRDVAPAVNDIEGCFVYDIDDLQEVAAENQASRSREALAAERIVGQELEVYRARLTQKPATEAIKLLLAEAEALRQQEIIRLTHRLAGQPLSDEQLAGIDAAMKALTAKLLHPQIAALKSARTPRDE